MKVEKTEAGEQLIIQSDDGNREIIIGWLFVSMLGVVFSKHRAKCLKWMRPYTYCTYIRPLSSFFVNFYSLGIREGHGDYKSQMEAYRIKTGKKPLFKPEEVTRKSEVYAADKFEFLKYMDLWQVEIEGLAKLDRLLYAEEYDKR